MPHRGLTANSCRPQSVAFYSSRLRVWRDRAQCPSPAIVQMVQFPMMFLSGALFPLDFLPEFLHPIAVVLPLTYLADIRQIMVDATPRQCKGSLATLHGCVRATFRFFRWE